MTRNKVQIVGNKIYWNMVCVGQFNEFSMSKEQDEFKRLLIYHFNREPERLECPSCKADLELGVE